LSTTLFEDFVNSIYAASGPGVILPKISGAENPQYFTYEEAVVVRIIDGDTIVANVNHQAKGNAYTLKWYEKKKGRHYRLLKIDSPEIAGTKKDTNGNAVTHVGHLQSKEAKAYMESLCKVGSTISILNFGTGDYKRYLAYIFINKNICANLEMVIKGLAITINKVAGTKQITNSKYDTNKKKFKYKVSQEKNTTSPTIDRHFKSAQDNARSNELGIWASAVRDTALIKAWISERSR